MGDAFVVSSDGSDDDRDLLSRDNELNERKFQNVSK
jgi:hypothetical protein